MSAETGYLYCVINPAFPDLVKIGVTTKHPLERPKELSAVPGIPTPFVLAYHRYVAYPFQAEAKIHRLLEACRVNDSREFFKLPLHKAIEMVNTFEELASPAESLPWADLFATFPDDGQPRKLTAEEQAKCRALEARLRVSYQS